jgi:hypothetical protein
MHKALVSVLLVLSCHVIAGEKDDGFIPSEKEFQKMNRQKEYFDTKLLMINSRKAVFSALEDGSAGGGRAEGNSSSPECNDKASRGKDVPRYCLDQKGNRVELEREPPTAFVSAITGVSGNLSAEVIWGGRILTWHKGDVIGGGRWAVKLVTRDDVVLTTNKGKNVRIGMIPVDINALLKL